MAYFSLSIFSADFCNIGNAIKKAEECKVNYLHFDVMDGHFVPMLGFGISALERIKEFTYIPIDVHLMVNNLNKFVKEFSEFHVNSINIHIENNNHKKIINLLKYIKSKSIKPSIAISPDTDILELNKYLDYIDEVLIMSALPGVKNSSFIPAIFERINKANYIISSNAKDIMIAVDGALDEYKALKCIENGAKKIIIGREFFKTLKPLDLVSKISIYN